MPCTLTRIRPGPVAAVGFLASWLSWAGGGLAETPPAGESETAEASAVIRDGFESPGTVWKQEQTDTTITLKTHERTTRAAHEGRTSERFRFGSGLGSGFYFSYGLPKLPVTAALRASLFVRASRAGVQVYARVVLPADTDPETKQPSYLLVPGTIYDNVDRWQRLEVLDLRASLERQARVLRASSRRPVGLDGAYLEQIVVNLYTGSGDTEVFLDELSVGPVPAGLAAAHAGAEPGVRPGPVGVGVGAAADPAPPPGKAQARVRLDRNRLKRRGDDGLYQDWVFTGVLAPGADVASLRNVGGFDVLIDDLDAEPKRWADAAARGFLLMPKVGRRGDGPPDPDRVFAAASGFPHKGSVLAWDLGDRLGLDADLASRKQELNAVRSTVSKLRELPAGTSRLTTGTVEDDLRQYARAPQNLDMMGIRPTAWASSHSPISTYQYLRQRRDLTVRSNAGALYWAMLPAAAPASTVHSIWGHDVPPAWGNPVVQPEQLRLMTYAALSAGYRGLAYQGDAELTRGTDPGRMLLLEMALLNAEIDLCESIIANGADPIPMYYAFDPDPPVLPPPGGRINQATLKKEEMKPLGAIRTSAIGTRDRRGVLLLVADYNGAAQFQPAQSSRDVVKITVIVPEGAQAFEISPGRVRVLERERAVGGTRLTLPEFDSTALILVTTDVAMAERVRQVVTTVSPRASLMAIEQAEAKLRWVTEINGRLAADGHYLITEKELKRRASYNEGVPTDQADLLAKAAENIKAARENAERLDWETAWSEARRASRPLRILMRGLWDNAYADMVRANTPAEDVANEENIAMGRVKRVGPAVMIPAVASPPLAAFNTLPQHHLWVDWMKSGRFGRNLVPSGSFDDPDTLKTAGWTNESYPYDGVKAKVTTEAIGGDQKRRGVKMFVEASARGGIDGLPPFLDLPVASIRSPAVKVRAGQFLKVSVDVLRAVQTPEGYGGLIIRDSIGGEALQFVSNEPIPKRTKVILYRRAAADGDFTVTLGLAGYGEAYFDDLSVQRVEAAPTGPTPDVARSPRTRSVPSTAVLPPPGGRAGR